MGFLFRGKKSHIRSRGFTTAQRQAQPRHSRNGPSVWVFPSGGTLGVGFPFGEADGEGFV